MCSVCSGRAIRHRQDYATILLLDHRYSTPRVYNKLPGWIGSRMQQYSRFGPAFAAVRKVKLFHLTTVFIVTS